MQLRQTIIEINGVPPTAFTPGRRFEEIIGRGHHTDIALRTHHSVTLNAASSHGVSSQVTFSQTAARVISLTLEVKNKTGQMATLTDIPFAVTGNPARELIFNSESQGTPWNFLMKVNSETGQMTLGFTLNYSGLDVANALSGAAFYEALSHGGEFRIHGRHPITGGEVSLARGDLPSGKYEPSDPRFVRLLKDLTLIQDKTGVSFKIPHTSIDFQETNTIAATAKILRTGHAQYASEPWESISNVEQARFALESFRRGGPAPMALHYEGQVVVIFGVPVPLGPVTLFCDRSYITENDLAVLRKDIEAVGSEDCVSIRFTPFEDCPIEARYVKWLPEDEAAAIQALPMYGATKEVSTQDEWALPQMNANDAVALLKSWYDEDPDEQTKSWKQLKVALDEDRLSDRKLFS